MGCEAIGHLPCDTSLLRDDPDDDPKISALTNVDRLFGTNIELSVVKSRSEQIETRSRAHLEWKHIEIDRVNYRQRSFTDREKKLSERLGQS
jgi:hypothetical protein